MDVKYQIFVSSTYNDLRNERDAVKKAILEMSHIPVGMEMFSAGDETQWAMIQRRIDSVDYYVVLIAHRYGTRDGSTSYTEKEYDYAISKSIPVLALVIEPDAPWNVENVDTAPEDTKALNDFRLKAQQRVVSFWTDANDLYGKSSIALIQAFAAHPRPGWLPATAAAGPEVIGELSRLSAENANLRSELKSLRARTTQDDEDDRRRVLRLLRSEEKIIYFRGDNNEFKSDDETATLDDIFHIVAPMAMVESSFDEVIRNLALQLCGREVAKRQWPLPSNTVHEWLADLVALGLMKPSVKRHPVSDTNEYWSLDTGGIQLWRSLRISRLDDSTAAKLAEQTPPPDDANAVDPRPAATQTKTTHKRPKKAKRKNKGREKASG